MAAEHRQSINCRLTNSVSRMRAHIGRSQPSPRKPAVSPMLGVLLGRHQGEPGTQPTPLDERITHGHRYGRVTVNKIQMRRSGERREYRFECRCGSSGFLDAKGLLALQALDSGCLSFDCSESPIRIKCWYNPRYALWVQLSHALSRYPDEVCNEWGGNAYTGLPSADPTAGFDTLLAEIGSLISVEDGRWWLVRVNSAAPWSCFNVRLQDVPSKDLFSRGEPLVRYGSAVMTIPEAANLIGVEASTAFDIHEAVADSDTFFDELLAAAAREQEQEQEQQQEPHMRER